MIKTPRINKCLLLFSIVFLSQYALEHAVYLLTDSVYSGDIYMSADVLSVIRLVASYLTQAIETLSLGVCAILVLAALVTRGVGRAAAIFVVTAAAKLLYILPHYYMTVMSYGYDTLETFLFLLPITMFILVLMLAEISAAIALGAIPAAIDARKGGTACLRIIRDGLSEHELLDVGNRGTAAIAIIAAATSIKSLVTTIIDTASFFSEQGDAFYGADIFAILFDFFYVFALTAISYFLMHIAKKRLLRMDGESADCEYTENNQEEDNTNEGH